jgi:hypothetical protein
MAWADDDNRLAGGRRLTDEEEEQEGSLRSNNKMLKGEAASHKQELEALKKKVSRPHPTPLFPLISRRSLARELRKGQRGRWTAGTLCGSGVCRRAVVVSGGSELSTVVSRDVAPYQTLIDRFAPNKPLCVSGRRGLERG